MGDQGGLFPRQGQLSASMALPRGCAGVPTLGHGRVQVSPLHKASPWSPSLTARCCPPPPELQVGRTLNALVRHTNWRVGCKPRETSGPALSAMPAPPTHPVILYTKRPLLRLLSRAALVRGLRPTAGS